jgi:hypothetical protein
VDTGGDSPPAKPFRARLVKGAVTLQAAVTGSWQWTMHPSGLGSCTGRFCVESGDLLAVGGRYLLICPGWRPVSVGVTALVAGQSGGRTAYFQGQVRVSR